MNTHDDDGGLVVRFRPSSIHNTDTTKIQAATYLSDNKYDLYADNRRITIQLRPSRSDRKFQGVTLELSGSEAELTSVLTRALASIVAIVAKARETDSSDWLEVTLPRPEVEAHASSLA